MIPIRIKSRIDVPIRISSAIFVRVRLKSGWRPLDRHGTGDHLRAMWKQRGDL